MNESEEKHKNRHFLQLVTEKRKTLHICKHVVSMKKKDVPHIEIRWVRNRKEKKNSQSGRFNLVEIVEKHQFAVLVKLFKEKNVLYVKHLILPPTNKPSHWERFSLILVNGQNSVFKVSRNLMSFLLCMKVCSSIFQTNNQFRIQQRLEFKLFCDWNSTLCQIVVIT